MMYPSEIIEMIIKLLSMQIQSLLEENALKLRGLAEHPIVIPDRKKTEARTRVMCVLVRWKTLFEDSLQSGDFSGLSQKTISIYEEYLSRESQDDKENNSGDAGLGGVSPYRCVWYICNAICVELRTIPAAMVQWKIMCFATAFECNASVLEALHVSFRHHLGREPKLS